MSNFGNDLIKSMKEAVEISNGKIVPKTHYIPDTRKQELKKLLLSELNRRESEINNKDSITIANFPNEGKILYK